MNKEQINTLKNLLDQVKNEQGERKRICINSVLAYLDGCLSGIE